MKNLYGILRLIMLLFILSSCEKESTSIFDEDEVKEENPISELPIPTENLIFNADETRNS